MLLTEKPSRVLMTKPLGEKDKILLEIIVSELSPSKKYIKGNTEAKVYVDKWYDLSEWEIVEILE
jgi:hypothetical protein